MGGIGGGWGVLRRVATRVVVGGLVVSTAVTVAWSAGSVSAAAPNPTSSTGTATIAPHPTTGQQAIKVVLEGTWDWQRGKPCSLDRWAVGWEVDWNDPNQPGHVVTTLN